MIHIGKNGYYDYHIVPETIVSYSIEDKHYSCGHPYGLLVSTIGDRELYSEYATPEERQKDIDLIEQATANLLISKLEERICRLEQYVKQN